MPYKFTANADNPTKSQIVESIMELNVLKYKAYMLVGTVLPNKHKMKIVKKKMTFYIPKQNMSQLIHYKDDIDIIDFLHSHFVSI